MHIKYFKIYFILSLLIMLTACDDDEFKDINIGPPSDLVLDTRITDDDSGLVTVIPTATGASKYEIAYGDGSGEMEDLLPGESGSHIYAEGDYTLSMKAYGLGGQSAEITKDIMVRFTPPENLALNITIDPVNTNVVTVAPTADNAMNFDVYFGEVEDEEPTVIDAGASVNHTYAESGTYTIRVVAKSASSTTLEASEEVMIVRPTVQLTLPIDFENPDISYVFEQFGGAELAVIDNPDPTGLNTSGKVAQLVKTDGAEVWGGGFLQLPAPIDFSSGTDFKLQVWSPKQGATVRLKIENETDPNIFFELDAVTATSNAWEELSYDFSGADQSQSYHKVVVFMDFGNNGDGSTYYFDDISLGGVVLPNLTIPVDFEDTNLDYTFENFGGATSMVIDNPDASGINTSAKVANLFKQAGSEVWAGSFLQLDQAIDFMNNDLLMIDIWSPKQGAVLRAKVESSVDPQNIFAELDFTTTTSNTWETATFDFSAIDANQNYDRVVVFFDFGVNGDDSNYYFDNIRVRNSAAANVVAVPVDFESADLMYSFTDFGGAGASVIDNPDASGINTSAKVANLNKGEGSEVWAGSFLQLDEPLDFMNNNLLLVDIWSPKQGITLRAKVENSANPENIFAELDFTTTTSNTWETASFDFTAIDATQDFDRVVLFFDFGVNGDGSDYYFDNIRLESDIPAVVLELPIDFESADLQYSFNSFGNVSAEVSDNPMSGGINTSAKVGKLLKPGGAETWGGTFLTLPTPIDFSQGTTFDVKVYSPKANIPILLKVENFSDGNIFYELQVNNTVANEWETITFDLSAIDQGQSYSKIVLFFDFGTNGDDSEYFFDDITLR